MVTPLNADGSLDLEGTERLVEHILAGGVHGLFLLGTTGEAPDLLSDMLGIPVTTRATAGEGGAWGIAKLAMY